MAIILLILTIAFLILLVLLVRGSSPSPGKLIIFLLLLADGAVLAYLFLVVVFKWDPNPTKLRIANYLSKNKLVDLTQFVPGLYNMDYIWRLDTDGDTTDTQLEWLAFYRYDVTTKQSQKNSWVEGPFGAAVYDINRCRPPAIPSYELAPISYDYLGQDGAKAAAENAIDYKDPLSGGLDRPELFIAGFTRGVVTDLNIFRKVGSEPDCLLVQDWIRKHPGQPFPYGEWLSYANVGSFRGNYSVRRNGSTVTVVDSAGFERSQFTVEKSYRPVNGSYFQTGTQTLLDPVEYSLAFGPGQPDQIPQVYYPEKTVLAFYKSLTKDTASLERAKGYLSDGAKTAYNINTDSFGLSTASTSVAMARDKLARVLVWQIKYEPDIQAEQLHAERQVTAVVVGVDKDGNIDYAQPCQVTWRIIGVPNPSALPYGCEWRLDGYVSTCPAGEKGDRSGSDRLASQVSP
jgi:hypothetical protein